MRKSSVAVIASTVALAASVSVTVQASATAAAVNVGVVAGTATPASQTVQTTAVSNAVDVTTKLASAYQALVTASTAAVDLNLQIGGAYSTILSPISATTAAIEDFATASNFDINSTASSSAVDLVVSTANNQQVQTTASSSAIDLILDVGAGISIPVQTTAVATAEDIILSANLEFIGQIAATALAGGPEILNAVTFDAQTSVVASANDLSIQTSITLLDSFEDTDGVDINAHTPNQDPVGTGWERPTVWASGPISSWIEIFDNQLHFVSSADKQGAVIDSGRSDGTVWWDWTPRIGGINGITFFLRFSDFDNCLFLRANQGDSTLSIRERDAGSQSTLDSAPFTYNDNIPYQFKIELNGTSIIASIDDTPIVSGISSVGQSITKHGIGVFDNDEQFFERFLVDDGTGFTSIIRRIGASASSTAAAADLSIPTTASIQATATASANITVTALEFLGSGTLNDPYVITTATQLQRVEDDKSAHYILGNDIDASETSTWNSGAGFLTIGKAGTGNDTLNFQGNINGNGHVISGLFISAQGDNSGSYTGLFGTNEGAISGMSLINPDISGDSFAIGGIAGLNNGIISQSEVWGGVISGLSTETNHGGLTGYNYANGNILDCRTNCTVVGGIRVGGLAGWSNNAISRSFATGQVSGASDVGGLVGLDQGGTVDNDNFWDTQTTGQASSAAGTGKTTSEMQNVATFTDTTTTGLTSPWDFVGDPNDDVGSADIWDINGSYPFLTALSQSYFFTVTIDNTQINSNLTDFPVYVDLSDLAGSHNFWSRIKSNGEDIRVTESDGTTEVPFDLVSIDTVANTGELYFKADISSTVDTEYRVYYNGEDTAYAPTDPFGRNNVWTNYEAVFHMNNDPSDTAPQLVDVTGNGNDLTTEGTMTSGDLVSGKIGEGVEFDGSDDGATGSTTMNIANAFTVYGWINLDATQQQFPDGFGFSDGAADFMCIGLDKGFSLKILSNGETPGTGTSLSVSTWYMLGIRYSGAGDIDAILNGAVDYSSTPSGSNWQGSNTFTMAFNGINERHINAILDEIRYASSEFSIDYLGAQHTNINTPTTFYTLGSEQIG